MRDLKLRLGRLRGRLLRRLTGPGERGAIGVLVAVLIAGGVLFGMGALVIDTGQLYQNRAELQNGADAAALAVARNCVLSSANCTQSLAAPVAAQYASDNASKLTGGAAAASVCGSGSLGSCPADGSQIYNCPAPAAGANYVDVNTSTKLASGSTLLPPVFGGTLLGNGSYKGSTVYACAQAEWGAPLSATGLAFTISACSWDVYTSEGQTYAQPPPYPPNQVPSASLDHELQFHGSGSQAGCVSEPSGADAPGNFGWTSDPNGNCTVTVTGSTYSVKTGNSATNDCKTVLQADYTNKTLVYIPVYVSVTGSGANAVYTLKGFAAFVVTGYRVPGASEPDWLNPANSCSGSSFCLNGYFTQGLIPAVGGTLGGPNLGADIIKLTG